MEISLIRHGKSEWIENDKIAFGDFKKWVENYDAHGVSEETVYPVMTIEKVEAAKLVITSDLNRSIVSAKLLNSTTKTIVDALYRETELPRKLRILHNIKLKPKTWAVILRLLWFSGYSNQCESLEQARYRALQASQKLISYASEYDSIVLVGHGFFNMLIAKELKKAGWKGRKGTRAKHWNCTTYVYEFDK